MNDNFILLLSGYAKHDEDGSFHAALGSLVENAKASEGEALKEKGFEVMVRYLRSQGLNYTDILVHLGVDKESADSLVRVDRLYPPQIHAIQRWIETGVKAGHTIGRLMRGSEVIDVGVFFDEAPSQMDDFRVHRINGRLLVCVGGRTLKTEIHYLDHLDWWATAEAIQLPAVAKAA